MCLDTRLQQHYKMKLQQSHLLQEKPMVTASSSSSLPRLLGPCFSDHPRRDDGQYRRISKLVLMTVTCSDVDAMVPDGALKMVLTHRRKRNNEMLSY